jgi:hypothetical protein
MLKHFQVWCCICPVAGFARIREREAGRLATSATRKGKKLWRVAVGVFLNLRIMATTFGQTVRPAGACASPVLRSHTMHPRRPPRRVWFANAPLVGSFVTFARPMNNTKIAKLGFSYGSLAIRHFKLEQKRRNHETAAQR